ncbi:MFS transporter [Oscillatoriales cyanobacterium USR001]|nr:MFS transporter [Oscillatoriales cyanobacterium USR001]
MNIFSTLDPQRRRSLQNLFIAGLLFWSSLGSLLPTLPLYIQYVGGTKQQIGFVIGAFAIGLLLSRPWLGTIADTKSRKLVLLLGTLVAEIAPLAYIFVNSIPLLLVIRVFHGVSIAAFTSGYSALVTDLSPKGRKGELIGYMSLVNPIGFAVGPALGGYLQVAMGYNPLFLMSSILALLALIYTYQVRELNFPKPPKINSSLKVSSFFTYWQMLWNPRVRVPALVLLLLGLVFGTFSTFMPLFLQQTKVDLNPGLFYSVAAISSFAIRLFTGKASDKYGRGIFITGGLACYAIAMMILFIADDYYIFILAALFQGAGSGTVLPIMITLMTDRCEPHERGRLFSLCITGFDVGVAIAGPTLGFIAEIVGYRNMFGLAGLIGMLATILFITKNSKDLPHSLRFSLGQGKDVYALKN